VDGPTNTVASAAGNLSEYGISVVGENLLAISGTNRQSLINTLNSTGNIFAMYGGQRSVTILGCKTDVLQ
jgi:hypothetical protein